MPATCQHETFKLLPGPFPFCSHSDSLVSTWHLTRAKFVVRRTPRTVKKTAFGHGGGGKDTLKVCMWRRKRYNGELRYVDKYTKVPRLQPHWGVFKKALELHWTIFFFSETTVFRVIGNRKRRKRNGRRIVGSARRRREWGDAKKGRVVEARTGHSLAETKENRSMDYNTSSYSTAWSEAQTSSPEAEFQQEGWDISEDVDSQLVYKTIVK